MLQFSLCGLFRRAHAKIDAAETVRCEESIGEPAHSACPSLTNTGGDCWCDLICAKLRDCCLDFDDNCDACSLARSLFDCQELPGCRWVPGKPWRCQVDATPSSEPHIFARVPDNDAGTRVYRLFDANTAGTVLVLIQADGSCASFPAVPL